MYLKQLDLLGFKSFAHRTTVHFSSGITAIVGPNGCGKTNILDALRWVLGEQKVSLLRGAKMEEIIFNGTREVKPLGMAEVTLTVVNNRGVLPTEYHEVQISRRLFRSGESEYLMNKVPCRRKDIVELFADTGMGAHSYSVIQQDMVDAVISDRAEERRLLFEEAAGITKYKHRKRAALRKLEATEHDLLRLKDIHAEVQTQVRSLNRQQKKAQRYQTVLDDIKAWELHLSSVRRRTIETERRQLKADLDSRADQRLQRQAAEDRIQAQVETDRQELLQIEQELTAIGTQVYDASESAHDLETEVSVRQEKRSNNRTLIERNNNDIAALKTRRQILAEQTEQVREKLVELEEENRQAQERLKEAEKLQAELDARLLEARSERDQNNRQLLQLEGQLSSGKTEDDNLTLRTEELSEESVRLEREATTSEAALSEAKQESVDQAHLLDHLRQRREDLEAKRSQAQERIQRNTELIEQLGDEVSELTAAVEACQARKGLLEEMIIQYEGYSGGVVAVMEESEQFDGLMGTVAELFKPDKEYATATEAALGEMAGFLVCRSRDAAERIVEHLRRQGQGKVGILVPDSGTINPVVKRPELDQPHFRGWLDQFVSADEALAPLMQAVLARTAVFETGSDPISILERLPFGFAAVSTDGTYYSKNVIAGGSPDKLPLFSRRERVDEQESEIARLNEKLVGIRAERSRIGAAVAADRADSSSTSDALQENQELLSAAREKMGEVDARCKSLADEQARLQRELGTTRERLEQLRSKQYNLGLDFGQLSDRKDKLVDALSASDTALAKLSKDAAQATEAVSRCQVALVESRSAHEQQESRRTHLAELSEEIGNTIAAKQDEIVQAEREIGEAEAEIERCEQKLKVVFQTREEAVAKQAEHRQAQAEIQKRLTGHEEQLKQARSDRETIGEQIHKDEIRLNTLESEMRSLSERILDEYELDLEQVEAPCPDETMDQEQAREHLFAQKEKLKKFGAVNLLALEEYKTAVEREAFLAEQLTDLTQAKDDLTATISQINRHARQLFDDTFNKVKQNFRSLFVELFTGGEADIFLEDPSNPLESDIQIIARPRGKKLLSITMMSGGERALTAIALLFSLYLVKPSPFCILDEIDAPLDDANCRRFLNIIAKFSEQTQFITITHNKITMETADNLYGITMEQAGISKLVAVRFGDARPLGDETILAVETSASGESDTVNLVATESPVVADMADDGDPEV